MPLPRSQIDVVAGGVDPGRFVPAPVGVTAASYSFASRLFRAREVCPAHERHVRRPTWTDLFFDLVFAAAIAQLSAPLDHDYSFYGITRFAFLLALVFFAWFGYTTFSTQFAIDDVVERVIAYEPAQLIHVCAGFAREPGDERRAEGDARDAIANALQELVVLLSRSGALHALEHRVRRVLQR